MNFKLFVFQRYCLLAIFMLSAGNSFCQNLNNLESVIADEERVFFDYRFYRNPAKIYRQLQNEHEDFLSGRKATILYHGYSVATFDQGKFVRKIEKNEKPIYYRVDFSMKPIIRYQFGDYSDPIKTQIGLSPMIKVIPTKGLYAVAQWNFPIQNDFQSQYALGEGQSPEQIGMGYDYIWQGRYVVSGYVGTLTNKQYGWNLELLGISRDFSWYYGAALFYSGEYLYHEMYLYREPVDVLSGYFQLAYRIKAIDLTIRAIGDLYLDGNKGITMEVVRQYGNTDIGFYGLATKGATSGGLFFRIPLWPGRIWSNHWLQMRTFDTQEQYYSVRTTAAMPRTRNYRSLLPVMMRYNPHFLNKQMQYNP